MTASLQEEGDHILWVPNHTFCSLPHVATVIASMLISGEEMDVREKERMVLAFKAGAENWAPS